MHLLCLLGHWRVGPVGIGMGQVSGGGIFSRDLVCVPCLVSTAWCVYVSVMFPQKFYVECVGVTWPYVKVVWVSCVGWHCSILLWMYRQYVFPIEWSVCHVLLKFKWLHNINLVCERGMDLGNFVISAEIVKAVQTDHGKDGCKTSRELPDCGIMWGA